MRAVNEGAPIVIPCNKGMDQSMHTRLSPIGTFELVQNMRIQASGIMEKRPGSRAIGPTLANCLPSFLGSIGDEPSFIASSGERGVVGNSQGVIYTHQEEDDYLIPAGRFSTCQPIRRRGSIVGFATGQTIAPAGFGNTAASTAVNASGYVAVAAVSDGGDLYVALQTPEGTRLATRSENTGTMDHVRVIAVDEVFYVTWIDGSNLKAQTLTIGVGSVTFSAETTVATNVHSTSFLDAVPVSSTTWAVAYQNTGAPSVDLLVLLMTGVAITATATIAINLASVPFSLYCNDTNIWVGWSNASNEAHVQILLAADVTTVRADTTIAVSPIVQSPGAPLFGAGSSASEAVAVIRSDDANALGFFCVLYLVPTAGSLTIIGTHYGMAPISKPDDDTRVWMMAGGSTGTLCRVFLARLFPYQANTSALTVELSLDEMPNLDQAFVSRAYFGAAAARSGRVYFAAPFVLAEIGGFPLTRVDLLEYSTTELEPNRSTVSANSSLFVAGQPIETLALPLGTTELDKVVASRYFAEGSAELGFVLAPVILPVVTPSGGAFTPGDYVFYAVYEWIDQRGQRHQSQPSEPSTVTITVNASSVAVKYTICEFTHRRSTMAPIPRPYLVFYRTKVGEVEAHRLPQADPSTTGTYAADAADSVIADQEILYTQGGVLANNLAPSCRFMRYAAGRLWCGGLWSEDLIEASKLIVPDEQPAFTNDATHRVSIGGKCTGLAVMDDQLVAFLEDGVMAVVGEGPNDQGAGGSFGVRSISNGIGCIDSRSIAETDIGIFFRSRLGFFLLPRGFGPPQYIGAQVKDITDALETTLGAAVWHGNRQHLARFLVQGGGDTKTLTYEINSGQWFVDTFARDMLAIGVWPEGFALCKTLGSLDGITANKPLWIEDPDEVADGVWASFTGHHIEQRVRTNWFTPAGPGGYAECKQTLFAMLSETASVVTLRFEADTDDVGHESSFSLSASEDPQYRYLVPLEKHGVGFRLSAWDGEVSSEPAAGLKFIAITVETEPDGGLRPPDAGERV